MALPQRKFREILFQILYSCDFSEAAEEELIALISKEFKITRKTAKMAWIRAQEVQAVWDRMDQQITDHCTEYEFNRISRVERNILRLGIFEMAFDEKIPAKVAIAEAIRLCRKYGTPESAHFVNAILDALYQKRTYVQAT